MIDLLICVPIALFSLTFGMKQIAIVWAWVAGPVHEFVHGEGVARFYFMLPLALLHWAPVSSLAILGLTWYAARHGAAPYAWAALGGFYLGVIFSCLLVLPIWLRQRRAK